MITRNILEPKLLSASLELSQLSVLIAIFVGLNAGGFKGMIYLISLFIAFNFYKKYIIYEEKDLNCNSKIKKESNKVAKRNLREGDLVFFTSSRSKNKVAHVGIYLKNGKFIHSSTSKGVIVSNLNENYYTKHWISGGRIR